jgi:hypothetical protein
MWGKSGDFPPFEALSRTVDDELPHWPVIKTAKALVIEGIVPCSVKVLLAVAKRHGVGRKLGRTYVFTPADVQALINRLPDSVGSSLAGASSRPHRLSPARAGERARALVEAAKKRKRGL